MKRPLTDRERAFVISMLGRCNFNVVANRKNCINFKVSENSKTYSISHSSHYMYHIMQIGTGNTYGCMTDIIDLMSFIWTERNNTSIFS